VRSPVYHLVPRAEWQAACARGVYAPASLETHGFIHCSTRAQVAETANRWLRGQRDLLLLEIDPRQATADLRFEPPVRPSGERPGERFPHLYGPLNLEAVTRVVEFPCQPDGSFHLPEALGE